MTFNSSMQLSLVVASAEDIVTQFNVKNFGAVGDGTTDDTTAIQNCYNAAAIAMGTQGGAGVVYFPPSTGYYKVTILQTPSMGYGQGWLTSIFDNGLFVNTIKPGNNNAFIGRTSNFAGIGGSFVWGPNAEWQQPKGLSSPLLDMAGGDQIYFEGISFGAQQPTAIHMHDSPTQSGCVYITFKRCLINGLFNIDTSAPNIVAGFGLKIEDSSLGDLTIQNFGQVSIRGSYIHSITMTNTGIASNGDLSVDDCLSEGLINKDFLTVVTAGGAVEDITLNRVKMADTSGSSYMLNHVNTSGVNWIVNAKISMAPDGNIGSGIVNPTSAPYLLSIICEGSGCQSVLNAESALYDALIYTPKNGLTVYGSKYLNPPFKTVQGT